MTFQALAPFFVVKVPKDQQKDNREKEGYFYTHSDNVFMQREIQHGEIVSIGKEAQDLFPTAKIGHTLIFHHFVTGRSMEDGGENRNLLHEDEFYNYYSVTIKSFLGERNLTYGIHDGEKIIPHKQFVFLNIQKVEVEVKETQTGLLEVENFTESRDEIGTKMKLVKDHIKSITNTAVSNDLTKEIEKKEGELNSMSKKINKKQILMYPVAYASEYLKSKFTTDFTKVAMLNAACNTKISVFGKEYIIADCKYLFGCAI